MSVEEIITQEDSSDFESGFSGAAEATTTPPKDTPEPKVEEQPAPVEPEPKYAQITEDQLKHLLDSATAIDSIKADSKSRFDNAFGQLGGLKQKLEQMQAATPSGDPVVVTAEDFAELAEEYPDFAEKQMKVLNKVLGKMKGTAPAKPAEAAPAAAFDPTALEKLVGDKVAAVEEKIVESSLNAVFPGWKQEVRTEKFQKWMADQPVEVKNLAASNDVGDAARMLQLFRNHKPALPAQKSTRQKQIEAAVNPKGVGGPPPGPTADDEFMAGFNSA